MLIYVYVQIKPSRSLTHPHLNPEHEEDLDLMHKVLPDPESQGYANIVNTGPWFKNAKQTGADAAVQFSAKAGKTPSISECTPKDSGERTILAQPLEHISALLSGWPAQNDRSDVREHSQVFDRFLVQSSVHEHAVSGPNLFGSYVDYFRSCHWNPVHS